MGKLILCSGCRANRPYIFTTTDIRIFSMEELCYYIYNYIYIIDEHTFSDSLIDWIGSELKLTERAAKLSWLKKNKADLKTMVTAILCSADYYTEQEIKSLLNSLDRIIGMPAIMRQVVKANSYLKKKLYSEAEKEYMNILALESITDLKPEEYGDLLHNLAVAKVHTAGLSKASEIFLRAYSSNHRLESLLQYLYTIGLSNNRALLMEKLEEYQVDEDSCQRILTYLEQLYIEAQESLDMKKIIHLENLKAMGSYKEYEYRAWELLESWKGKLRN